MAESTQRLEIVTPEKKVLSEDVEFVVLPGKLGELGILPNHAPLLSSLAVGLIRVHQGGKVDKIAVSGGFAEVRNSRVTVLADTAERCCDINRERAEAARIRAEKRLAEKTPDIDLIRAEMALKRAINRLKALQ